MANTLAQKMKLKEGMALRLVNAPQGIADELRAAHASEIADSGAGPFDAVLLFARDSSDLTSHLANAEAALKPGGQMWMAYPKKSSGVESDLTRDVGWAGVTAKGWQVNFQVSIDDTWSALRFKWTEDAEVRGSLEEQYAGPKAALLPIYHAVVEAAKELGDDVQFYFRKNYVAINANGHFAAIAPTTRTRVDLALKLRDTPASGRLEAG